MNQLEESKKYIEISNALRIHFENDLNKIAEYNRNIDMDWKSTLNKILLILTILNTIMVLFK